MKTILLLLSITTSVYASAAGWKDKSVSTATMKRNLFNQFGEVENVSWSSAANNMTRADFQLEDEKLTAWFDETGNYVAQTRELNRAELPKKIRISLEGKAPRAEVLAACEMINDQEKAWFIETRSGAERKVWKGNSSGRVWRYYPNR